MAVIIKKVDGKPVFNGLNIVDDLKERALKLDKELEVLGPQIEKMWREKGIKKGKKGKRNIIDVKVAYNIGKKLADIINNKDLVFPKERHWVWKALREMYLPQGLFKYRGRKRDDLEYFYKATKYPFRFIKLISWDGFARILDYTSIREDERFEEWLQEKAKKSGEVKKGFIRKFAKILYLLIKNKDTTVFSDKELREIYESAWKESL